MNDPDKQWRIENADHLRGLRLRLQPYRPWSQTWEHDHCAACYQKLSENSVADSINAGYATLADYVRGERYEWICPPCFDDLKDDMKWTAAPD